MNPRVQTISMWDSPGTFTKSPDLPSDRRNLMACSANPLYCSKKILGNVADLISQRFLGARSKNCSRFWLQWRQKHSRISGNTKQQPESTILNKTGPGMTFCYEKLNTAGLPNALLVPFPCFSLFSNSVCIAFLLLGHSYTRQKKNHLLTQQFRISKGILSTTDKTF